MKTETVCTFRKHLFWKKRVKYIEYVLYIQWWETHSCHVIYL